MATCELMRAPALGDLASRLIVSLAFLQWRASTGRLALLSWLSQRHLSHSHAAAGNLHHLYWPMRGLHATLFVVVAVGVYVAFVRMTHWALAAVVSVTLLFMLVAGWTLVLLVAYRRLLTIRTSNIGSARVLRGTCAVLETFVGDDWQEGERHACRAKVTEACAWLEEQAASRGVVLSMKIIPVPLSYCDRIKMLVTNKISLDPKQKTALVEEVGREMDGKAMAGLDCLDVACDSHFLVVHVKQEGQGYAFASRNISSVDLALEFCVVDQNEGTASYAHEILHLFGAPDLYGCPALERRMKRPYQKHGSSEGEIEEVTMEGRAAFLELFREDIMSLIAFDCHDHAVGPITAHAVGWTCPWAERRSTVLDYERAVRKCMQVWFLRVHRLV